MTFFFFFLQKKFLFHFFSHATWKGSFQKTISVRTYFERNLLNKSKITRSLYLVVKTKSIKRLPKYQHKNCLFILGKWCYSILKYDTRSRFFCFKNKVEDCCGNKSKKTLFERKTVIILGSAKQWFNLNYFFFFENCT